MDKLLTKTEVAALLGVSERTIDRLEKQEKIKRVPNGRQPRYTIETIKQYIEGRKIDAN